MIGHSSQIHHIVELNVVKVWSGLGLTVQTQSSELFVSHEVVICHLRNVVECQINAQGEVRYLGNVAVSDGGAVTKELPVTVFTDLPAITVV